MHEDPEKGMERLEAQLRADSPEANVEICFSFDTTGSMAGYINEVKNKVEQLVGQLLGDLPNIRISILAHGDYCDHAKYVLRRLDLSNVAEELTDFVRGVQSTHGGDGDECYELALREVQGLSWSPASAKALVVIGDAAPHKKHEYRQIDWEEELQKLKAMGVKVYGVRCGSTREKFYETIAEETGGATLELANLQGITEMVMGLCYREAAAEHARRREAMDAASSSSSSSSSAGGAEEASMMEAPAAEDSEGPSSSASSSASASSEEALAIHRAIHAGERSVTVRGREHAICVGFAGCRFVKIGEETYIEQNKDKSSKYARWAIDGRKITWIIRKGNWGLIMDESPKIQSTKAHTGH